uniref:DUF641 domain-containing protein n=1 Tax=Kalanchoe fedtschenkoi TaxID=63787 RepID=A0A7N0V1J8_KALFE
MESQKGSSCLRKCNLPGLFRSLLKCPENEKGKIRDLIDKECDSVGCSERSCQAAEAEANNEQVFIMFTRVTMEKVFASLAMIKAFYVWLQFALFPYNAGDVIQSDELIVNEFRRLSLLLRSFHGREQLELPGEESALAISKKLSACIQTYQALVKKLEVRATSKDSQTFLLKEELWKNIVENKCLMRTAGFSGSVSVMEEEGSDQSRMMRLSYFISELQHAIKSVRHFVKIMVNEMRVAADWDLEAAADALQPGLSYWGVTDICFAFESFICLEMFEAFQLPHFGLTTEALPRPQIWRRYFLQKYLELKPMKPGDCLSNHPESLLASFCRWKYQQVVNSKMELSFFGNLNFRNHIKLGGFPEAPFIDSFLEMARRVLRLHYLALSTDPVASIFCVPKGSRFSELYMESVHEDPFLPMNISSDTGPRVAFTVVPGFKLGRIIIQSQVYFSKHPDIL